MIRNFPLSLSLSNYGSSFCSYSLLVFPLYPIQETMARTDGTEDGNGGSDKNNTNTGGGQHFRKPPRPPSPVAEEEEADNFFDPDDEYWAEGTGENLPEEDVRVNELSERSTGNASPPPEPAVEEETVKRKLVVTTAEEVKMINEVNKKWREETGKLGWRYTDPDERGRRKMYFDDPNPNKYVYLSPPHHQEVSSSLIYYSCLFFLLQ